MEKGDFVKVGYKEYPVGQLEQEWASVFLQKRFDDEKGTKYFINVYFSKPLPAHLAALNNKPTARAQFDLENGTVNFELFHFESIEIMEAFFEKAFCDTQAHYYEGAF